MAFSAGVTVPGANGAVVTLSTGKGDVLNLAAKIGALLSSAQGAGTLTQTIDTTSGPIPIGTANGILRGPHTDYIVAADGLSAYVSDQVVGRDGVQVVSAGDTLLTFSDGVGLYDPTGTAEDVYRLYTAILNRTPAVAELQAWTNQVDISGVSLAAVADAIVASAEFNNDYGSLSGAAFINQIYENAFGRSADPAGLQGWLAALANGTTMGTVALDIMQSPEAVADSLANAGDNNEGEIYRLFEAAFGRSPDAGGLVFWSNYMANGATALQVAQAMVTTPEFLNGDAGLNDANFVTAMYQNALQRAPDAGGLQYWTAELQTGALSQADVLLAFADSVESRAFTAGATHANWVFLPGATTPSTTELFLNGPGGLNTSIPTSYSYVVDNDTSSDTLTGSNVAIATNDVGGTFFVSGNSTVAATGGNNTVTATGLYELSFGAGNNLVIASGSGTIVTGFGASTVVASNTSGPGNIIDSNGISDLVDAVIGNTTVNAAGNNSTIVGGLGDLTVKVTGSNDLVVGGAGTSMTVTASGKSSGLVVNAGTAPLTFVGNGATATILGGSAGSTLFGSANSNLTFSGPGDLAYTASAGNVTLNAAGSTGNDSVSLGGGKDSITLGSGSDTLTMGAGSATLDGGSGHNQYFFDANLTPGTADFVVTESSANVNKDTFNFSNYGGDPSVTSVPGAPVVVTLSSGTTITFQNVTNPALIHTQNI